MTSILTPYRRPGSLYKLAADKPSLALDTMVTPEVDTGAMSATALICSSTIDWDDEVIDPAGVEFESRYKANPVVLWEHGFNPEIPFPIGKCETPEGKLALTLAKGGIEATSFHTNKTRESEQIFDLIVEKIIRAASIHVDPLASQPHAIGSKRCTLYPKSSLLEWSWCCMGANPDAVAKVLGLNRLAGSVIIESLAKTLRPLVPQRRLFAGGWSPNSEETVDPTKPKTLAKDMDPLATEGAPPPATDPATDPALEEPSTDSPSGQVLSAIHSTIMGLLDNITAAANTYENPEAIAFVTDTLVPSLTDLMGQVDAAYSAVSGGKSNMQPDGEDVPPDEDVMKSWLSSNRSRGFQLDGYSARLKLLGTAKNLTPDQRLTVTGIVKHISALTAKARESAKPAAPESPAVSPETLRKLDETATLFKSLAADLKAIQAA